MAINIAIAYFMIQRHSIRTRIETVFLSRRLASEEDYSEAFH